MPGRLSVLTGAPGSGKTTLLPGLRVALPGVVVLDLDDFQDAGSRLAGVDLSSAAAADRWPAYDDLCLTLVSAVLGAGHDVLLASPFDPPQVARSSAADALGEVRWAVLDCSDATRRSRLAERSYGDGAVGEALADAAELRGLGVPVLVNDGIGRDAAVELVVSWMRGAR